MPEQTPAQLLSPSQYFRDLLRRHESEEQEKQRGKVRDHDCNQRKIRNGIKRQTKRVKREIEPNLEEGKRSGSKDQRIR